MNIQDILKENEQLKKELHDVKEHLKKYTAPKRNTVYYENHKEELLKKMKENPPSSDKRKEYNSISYQRRKEKQKEVTENK
jgi:hypothetical protein